MKTDPARAYLVREGITPGATWGDYDVDYIAAMHAYHKVGRELLAIATRRDGAALESMARALVAVAPEISDSP